MYYVLRINKMTDGTEKIGSVMPYDTKAKAKVKFFKNLVEDMENEKYVSGKVVLFNEDLFPEKNEVWDKDEPQTVEVTE